MSQKYTKIELLEFTNQQFSSQNKQNVAEKLNFPDKVKMSSRFLLNSFIKSDSPSRSVMGPLNMRKGRDVTMPK